MLCSWRYKLCVDNGVLVIKFSFFGLKYSQKRMDWSALELATISPCGHVQIDKMRSVCPSNSPTLVIVGWIFPNYHLVVWLTMAYFRSITYIRYTTYRQFANGEHWFDRWFLNIQRPICQLDPKSFPQLECVRSASI